MNIDHLLDATIEHYGRDAQLLKAAEECAELTAAILQYTARGSHQEIMSICEEIADVKIMISQLERIFSKASIHSFESDKIERLASRIGYKE